MARKPETAFYTSVNRLIDERIHREKTHNPFRGGTFDFWYSGLRDLWVEYKFSPNLHKRKSPLSLHAREARMLSALQVDWARGRIAEGREVWVIVGSQLGGYIRKGQDIFIPILPALTTREQIAAEIQRFAKCPTSSISSPPLGSSERRINSSRLRFFSRT